MKILALEFSSSRRSAAVAEKSAPSEVPRPLSVAQTMGGAGEPGGLGLAARALAEAGIERRAIDRLAIGLGPGSYTGIRAALSLGQGWQLALGTPVVGISSSECLAAQVEAQGVSGRVHLMIDAQRNEFYLETWHLGGGRRLIDPLRLISFEEARRLTEAGEVIFGPDLAARLPGTQEIFPDAAILACLGCGREGLAEASSIEPIYLRETSFVKAPPPRVL